LQVLFKNEDLSLLPAEVWWESRAASSAQENPNRSTINTNSESEEEGPVTDSEDSDASVASLESFDNAELERPVDLDKKWRPLQLHNMLADIRQNENPVLRVESFQKLEPLVR
jgi:hypothetical protein